VRDNTKALRGRDGRQTNTIVLLGKLFKAGQVNRECAGGRIAVIRTMNGSQRLGKNGKRFGGIKTHIEQNRAAIGRERVCAVRRPEKARARAGKIYSADGRDLPEGGDQASTISK